MKDQTDFDGRARALERRLVRFATITESCVERRPRGWWFLILLRAGERGQSLVEFALIMPVLLLLTTGIFVFGIAMNNYMQLTNAVSVGARTVAISSGVTADPCATAVSAIETAAPGLNGANMTFSYSIVSTSSGTTTTTNATGTSCTADAGKLTSGSTVSVTATYPLNLSIYGKVFNAKNAVLQASSTELVQ